MTDTPQTAKRPRLGPSVRLSGGASLPNGLVAQWREGVFCDAEVVAGDTTFQVHRCVLGMNSDYYKALFTAGMSDAKGPLELEGVEACSFKAIVDFLYLGETTLSNVDQLVPVFEASARLQFIALRDLAVKAIVDRLSATSCIGALILGQRYNLPDFERSAHHFCLMNFEEARATGHLGALSQTCLESLLAHNDLQVVDEESAFAAVVGWYAVQSPTPSDATIGALMGHVRFRGIRDEGAERVMSHPLMEKRECMQALVQQTLGTHSMQPRCCLSVYACQSILSTLTADLPQEARPKSLIAIDSRLETWSVINWRSPEAGHASRWASGAFYSGSEFVSDVRKAIANSKADWLVSDRDGIAERFEALLGSAFAQVTFVASTEQISTTLRRLDGDDDDDDSDRDGDVDDNEKDDEDNDDDYEQSEGSGGEEEGEEEEALVNELVDE
jgi:hypothetical protein